MLPQRGFLDPIIMKPSKGATVVSIVLSLPELYFKTMDEQFNFFFGILGEPEHILEYENGKIENFQYDGEFQVLWDDYGNKVGVEKIIFDRTVEYGDVDVDLTIEQINNHAEELAKMFGKKPKDCRLCGRTWYDDELFNPKLDEGKH
jgi:hypothetical protein